MQFKGTVVAVAKQQAVKRIWGMEIKVPCNLHLGIRRSEVMSFSPG
jgi:hypothetical protein